MESLVKYEAMCSAIEAAHAVDEVKDIRDKAMAIQMYAKQAKNIDAERHASEIRVRAERRCGELLAEMPKAKGAAGNPGGQGAKIVQSPNGTTQTLSDLGISKRQSSEWQKLAAVPEAQFEESLSSVFNHRAQGTGENEWYTPSEYVEAVRDVLGVIDLDPASSLSANKTVKAKRFYSKGDDGLSRSWESDTLWMNPPYSQPHITQFVEKLVNSVESGYVTEAIALTHNYTDTTWFHLAQKSCNAICFTRGRIGFESPDGLKASATQGQAFFYFGSNVKKFADRFMSIGFVVVPYAP